MIFTVITEEAVSMEEAVIKGEDWTFDYDVTVITNLKKENKNEIIIVRNDVPTEILLILSLWGVSLGATTSLLPERKP